LKLSIEYIFEHNIDTVWSIFKNKDFIKEKYLAGGAVEYELLNYLIEGERCFIDVSRTMPINIETLPKVLSKIINANQVTKQLSKWNRVSDHKIEINLEVILIGKPIKCFANGHLIAVHDDETKYIIDFDVSSSLPFFGSKFEEIFCKQTKKSMDFDFDFAKQYIEKM
jgi:hypothetical protein